MNAADLAWAIADKHTEWSIVEGCSLLHTERGEGTIERVEHRRNYLPLFHVRFFAGLAILTPKSFENRKSVIHLGPHHVARVDELRAARVAEESAAEVVTAKSTVEEVEFQSLLAEMMQKGFTHSSQVSRFIVANQLGMKYRNISGVLKMELDGTVWDFKGGFPPAIYARLCESLDLSNEGSRAKPIAFESFGNLDERSRKE